MTINSATDLPYAAAIKQFRYEYFLRHIHRSGGNIYRIAEDTNVKRTTLVGQINTLGLRDELGRARGGVI